MILQERMIFTKFEKLGFGEYKNKKIVLYHADDEKNSVKFQIPKMYMPYGISGFEPPFGQIKYNAEFALYKYNTEGTYINKFYNFLKNIENQVIQHVFGNSELIFGKAHDLETITSMFNSNIKERTDYDPKFRVKVDTVSDTNTIKPTIYDKDSNVLENEASRGIYAKYAGIAVVELASVYFFNGKFGLVWKLVEMKVFEPVQEPETAPDNNTSLPDFSFRD